MRHQLSGRGPSAGRRVTAVTAALLLAACGSGDADGRTQAGDAGDGPAAGQAAEGAPGSQAAPDTTEAGPGEEAGADTAGRPLTTLRVDGHEIRVEVADDAAERKRGLMHRDSLPEDEGMLFVYPEERTLSFWMRNTNIPLDIAFLDRRGTIVDIQSMDAQTDRLYESRQPAMYALEMNRGWFGDHGVSVGDRVEF